jgi:hypothetical protein
LRSSEANSRSLDVHVILASDTLSFAQAKPIIVKMGIASTHYSVSPLANLAAHRRDSEKMSLTSLCNRSTTRAPTDRSIPRRATFIEPTAHHTETCSAGQRGVLLPCGNRTPGGYALDGAFPALAKPITTLPKGKGRAPHRAMPPRRSVFDRVQGCSAWPLTPLVLPR